jgi:LAO/AO transport system kinase
MGLLEEVRSGDILTLARLLTAVENDTPEGRRALEELFPFTGNAHLVGISGAPGSGKSTLIGALLRLMNLAEGKGQGERAAVLAVDPSSPFSGGALLGDRLRLGDLAATPGVFVRSLASRGSSGGLARSVQGMVRVLDAAGFELILIETVGAGQADLDILHLAQTLVVVTTPNAGDDVQMLKAGLLETADVLVLNKADLPGAQQAELALREMLGLSKDAKPAGFAPESKGAASEEPGLRWQVPLIKTVAARGEGAAEVAQAMREHGAYLKSSGLWAAGDVERMRFEVEQHVRRDLFEKWRADLDPQLYERVLHRVTSRQLSPARAAGELLAPGEGQTGERER